MMKLNKIQETLIKNSPTILTGLGIAGFVSTTVMAVAATPKAMQLVVDKMWEVAEEEERDISPDARLYFRDWGFYMDTIDVVKAAYRCYIPAALMGVVSIGCIISASNVSAKRNAAIASLYTISERTLQQYQSKVIEEIGVKKERKIKDSSLKSKIDDDPVSNNEVIVTGNGEMLCYEALSGRYFNSDIETIRQSLNNLSRDLMTDMFITLNDVYLELGLKTTSLGDMMGWDVDDGLIEPYFTSQLAEGKTPCLVLDFKVKPRFVEG